MIHKLRGRVSTLVGIAAFTGFFYVLQGVNDVHVAQPKSLSCRITKACPVNVTYPKLPASSSTIPAYKPPTTLTTTTMHILPLPTTSQG